MGIKVLLVEDDLVMGMAGKATLLTANCDVDIAPSGAEAIKLSLANVYDLIFMDLGLGDTTGYAVTEAIKTNGMNTETPIVALTAHKKADVEENCLQIGMKDVLAKPLSLETAQNIIAKFVG